MKINSLQIVMMNNTPNVINESALNNANLANKINNSHSELAKNIVKNANSQIKSADNVAGANLIADAAVNEATNISLNGNNNAQVAAARVAKAAIIASNNMSNGNRGANTVANAALRSAATANSNSDPNSAALKVANAAIKAANKIEDAALEVVSRQNAKINAAVSHANVSNAAKKLSVSNSAGIRGYNKMLNGNPAVVKTASNGHTITTTGNVRNNKSGGLNFKRYQPALAHANKSNSKTGGQVYKEGVLKNIYKNRNGKQYTVSNGNKGTIKNFVYSGMNAGLFSGKMM